MKLTKQRLKEIIKEELSTVRESDWYDDENETRADRKYADRGTGLGDLQTEPRHEGGTPEERLLNKLLIVSNIGVGEGGAAAARKLGLGGDEEVIAYLDSLLGNQMYAPIGGQGDEMELEEGWGQGDTAYQQATQLLGKHAQMHGLRNQVADALRQKRVSPQQVQKAAQGAVSSYQVAQRLGLR